MIRVLKLMTAMTREQNQMEVRVFCHSIYIVICLVFHLQAVAIAICGICLCHCSPVWFVTLLGDRISLLSFSGGPQWSCLHMHLTVLFGDLSKEAIIFKSRISAGHLGGQKPGDNTLLVLERNLSNEFGDVLMTDQCEIGLSACGCH